MKKPLPKTPHAISRRKFLAASSGLGFLVISGAVFPRLASGPGKKETKGHQITAWVLLDPDGQIRIYNPAAEMGQGSMTALAVLIAEEMDADWAKVSIEHSPVEPKIYGMRSWGGQSRMITVGSHTISGYYDSLRQAGAQARYVLLTNVADKWGVPLTELRTQPGQVLPPKSNRSISF